MILKFFVVYSIYYFKKYLNLYKAICWNKFNNQSMISYILFPNYYYFIIKFCNITFKITTLKNVIIVIFIGNLNFTDTKHSTKIRCPIKFYNAGFIKFCLVAFTLNTFQF